MTNQESGRVDTEFARIAAADPDRLAVDDHTYGRLWTDARLVAARLRDLGVRRGAPVALVGHTGRQSLLAMLAILVAGGHYVPVDPGYPAPRVRQMLALSGAEMAVTCDGAEVPDVPGYDVAELLATATQPLTPVGGTPDELLYVMFTSGSTGQPKPVGVTHRGAVELALRDGPFRLTPSDVVLAHSTLAFDASTFEIWSALLVGARLVTVTGHPIAAHELAAAVVDRGVTVLWLTAPVFGLVAANHPDALGKLRLLVTGGDVVPPEHAGALREKHPETVLLNAYGPTENTTFSTAFPVSSWDSGQCASVPIGNQVAGTATYVLDEQFRPGTEGELFLGGDRLAIGYLGDPTLTAARFLPDPFRGTPGARMYRTGDVVRVLPGGALEFLGRRDDEVKVRGFRVTLGEAQAVLAAAPGVRDAAVLVTGTGAERGLAGFVTPSTVDVVGLRARLRETAAGQLIPDTLLAVDAFPLSPNGKLDRAALLARLDDAGTEVEAGDALSEIWQRRTRGPATPDADFFLSGGTSLDLMRLIEDVRTQLRVELDFAEVYATTSYAELADLVREQKTEAHTP